MRGSQVPVNKSANTFGMEALSGFLASYVSIVGSRALVKKALILDGFPTGSLLAGRFPAFVECHPGGLPGGLLFVGCHFFPCSQGDVIKFLYPGVIHFVGGTYGLLITKDLEAGRVSLFIASRFSCALV